VANIHLPMTDYGYEDRVIPFEYEDLHATMKEIRRKLDKIRSGKFETNTYTEIIEAIGSAHTLCFYVRSSSKTDDYEKESARRCKAELDSIMTELKDSFTCTCSPKRSDKHDDREPRMIKKKFGDKLYYAIDKRY